MTLEWLLILQIQRGSTLVFHRDFFALRHPVGRTLFHLHLPEIKIFHLFARTIPLSVGSCVVYVCFCGGFNCIIILKFCLYCVLSYCICMHVCIMLCKYSYSFYFCACSVCILLHLPELKLLINQSINALLFTRDSMARDKDLKIFVHFIFCCHKCILVTVNINIGYTLKVDQICDWI